jgi:hypothetical protein
MEIQTILKHNDTLVVKVFPKIIPFVNSTSPKVKEAIYNLLGDHFSTLEELKLFVPEVLRLSALSFAVQSPVVKLACVTFAFRATVMKNEQIDSLFKYILELANFDSCYDVRDYARLITALVQSGLDSVKLTQKREIHSAQRNVLTTGQGKNI